MTRNMKLNSMFISFTHSTNIFREKKDFGESLCYYSGYDS